MLSKRLITVVQPPQPQINNLHNLMTREYPTTINHHSSSCSITFNAGLDIINFTTIGGENYQNGQCFFRTVGLWFCRANPTDEITPLDPDSICSCWVVWGWSRLRFKIIAGFEDHNHHRSTSRHSPSFYRQFRRIDYWYRTCSNNMDHTTDQFWCTITVLLQLQSIS